MLPCEGVKIHSSKPVSVTAHQGLKMVFLINVPMRPLGLFNRRLSGVTGELIDDVGGAGVAGGFATRGDKLAGTSLEMASMPMCPWVVWRVWQ